MADYLPEFMRADVPFDKRIERFKEIVDLCKGKVAFLGGAGVSTGSGIPDFRSKDGIYNNPDPEFARYRPEYLLSHNCYAHKPQVFYRFYRKFADIDKYEPCLVHHKLAELERKGTLKGVITQNVDMLHEKAGSANVMKIHGTIGTNHCVRCGKEFSYGWFMDYPDLIPRCECGGQAKPDVTLYDEKMPAHEYCKAMETLEDTRCLIVGGTSLQVSTAASLVANYSGEYLVIINSQPTELDRYADVCFHEDINEVFGKL